MSRPLGLRMTHGTTLRHEFQTFARNEPTLNLPVRGAGRVLLCWLLKSGAAGRKKQRSSSRHSPGPKFVNSPRTSSATVAGHGSEDGKSCWAAQPRRLSPCLSSVSSWCPTMTVQKAYTQIRKRGRWISGTSVWRHEKLGRLDKSLRPVDRAHNVRARPISH